jgi:hypothetical protein
MACLPERLREVRHEIVRILDHDGQAHVPGEKANRDLCLGGGKACVTAEGYVP